ncbi:hypothetical phage membrane protein [Staphylococcus xylosus]|uniref:hypothetical protein n=1 Tax=Staphylococcus xylosus TaxID=1288 RepID=UPI00085CB0A9|nr:hypothetical protein [Staphylococcus xylosus]PTI64490.1 hypothetical protein BU095_05225 [Staphylococcus xylosus]SCU32055.1 hypothetical phage membrane protein [Staphylococcus xylosus]
MTEESKYVLRHEWVDSNGKIYERMNTDKIEYNKQFSDLNNKIDRQTDIAERQLDSQERQEKHSENLSKTMNKFADDFIKVKNKVEKHHEQILNFKGIIEEKQKGNVHLTGIIVGGIFSVIVAAIGAAQLFF